MYICIYRERYHSLLRLRPPEAGGAGNPAYILYVYIYIYIYIYGYIPSNIYIYIYIVFYQYNIYIYINIYASIPSLIYTGYIIPSIRIYDILSSRFITYGIILSVRYSYVDEYTLCIYRFRGGGSRLWLSRPV